MSAFDDLYCSLKQAWLMSSLKSDSQVITNQYTCLGSKRKERERHRVKLYINQGWKEPQNIPVKVHFVWWWATLTASKTGAHCLFCIQSCFSLKRKEKWKNRKNKNHKQNPSVKSQQPHMLCSSHTCMRVNEGSLCLLQKQPDKPFNKACENI